MHLLIIGGSDAGISAALRARELDPDAAISVLLADDYPNFSICGLPYFISGESPDWRRLAHRSTFPGIRILQRHKALQVDVKAKTVLVDNDGERASLSFDRLIIATGAAPVRPDIEGADLDGVFVLHTMEDSFALQMYITDRHVRRAVVIGAGYIGLEMSEALHRRGIAVTLLSRSTRVMSTVDPALGALVGDALSKEGIRVITGVSAECICPGLQVTDTTGEAHEADLVLFGVGVRPATDLARAAGADIGSHGAIAVSATMATNLPDIFAAGDCVETHHRLLPTPTWISLGTIAHKQGRVAGENAIGGDRTFQGTIGTQSLRLFGLVIARTGLLDHEAASAGFDPVTVGIEADDHKAYYPGSGKLHIRITGDRQSGRLLGLQIVGPAHTEVSKRIDIAAAAIFAGATVDQLNDLDLSYTPPLSSPWDPVQQAAQAWYKSF